MTQAREPLSIADGAQPTLTFSSKNKRDFLVTRNFALLLAALYMVSIIATGFVVHNFVKCPQIDYPSIETQTASCNRTHFHHTVHLLQNNNTLPNIEDDSHQEVDLRLPKSVVPLKYNIKLVPFIFEGNFTFNGEISTLIKVIDVNNNITLHATELDILKTEVIALNGTKEGGKVKIVGYSSDAEKQFYIIHLKDDLVVGDYYQINMKFIGKLNDNLHGFYRSSYKFENKTRWTATTQFQPTDARRAFPCFDEPALKAQFTISIAHPSNMTALSNMDVVGKETQVDGVEGYIWSHFRESLPMSTYLVAFVVSDFANVSDGNFAVWTRPDVIRSVTYALDIGPQILKYFEEFYKIKFPLPKIDMIALPDFIAGAMENWGLMTFRETHLLYDEDMSPQVNKARVASVVAHELAHQWFGNLVTPTWWSDLWLNEGFASYMEYVGVDAVEKSWKFMDQFVVNELHSVFGLDSLASSHQISVNVSNPEEISDIFDKISYGKGAAIIRMMDHFLTSDVFNKAITNYLNNKMYQCADQNDLWEALTEQARADRVFDDTMSVKVIMDTWTLQTGFPVLNVTRNYTTGDIQLDQERFTLITRKASNSSSLANVEPLWWIPITYTSKSLDDFKNTRPIDWMKGQKSITLFKTNVSADDWTIFNIQQNGFFRVNYDERNWKLIIAHLNDPEHFEEIHAANRAQILDDALNLALGGRLGYDIALDITKYLVHEREYVPWKAGLTSLGYIDSMLSKGANYFEYKTYILSLIESMYHEIGFTNRPNDTMLTIHKRIDVINIACLLEHEDCISQAVTHYRNWMVTPNPDVHNPISPNLRNTVYCTALRVGGAHQWQFARDRFQHAQAGSERELLLTALGCTRLPWLLNRYLDESLRNDTGIRKQDVFRVLNAVSSSVIGQPISFSFVRQNWLRIKQYFGSSASHLNQVVKYTTRKLNTQHELQELQRFASEHKGELGRIIEQAVEKAEANILWMKKNYATIVNWLHTRSGIK